MRPSSTIFFVNIAFLFVCFRRVNLQNTCDFDVKLKQMLLNEGFHRNMTYGLVFSGSADPSSWLYRDCTVALDQPLPAGVYVNEDELQDLRRSQRLIAHPKNRMNVELPAEMSESTNVYVMSSLVDDNAYMWLPVHARYHAARKGGGFARNNIPPPILYLRCPDERLSVCGRPVSFLCNGSDKDKCLWKQVPYSLLTEPIHWEIPVGDTDHYYVVATGTVAVITAGSLYLLYVIHQYQLSKKQR